MNLVVFIITGALASLTAVVNAIAVRSFVAGVAFAVLLVERVLLLLINDFFSMAIVLNPFALIIIY
jgi:hypothetical protein